MAAPISLLTLKIVLAYKVVLKFLKSKLNQKSK